MYKEESMESYNSEAKKTLLQQLKAPFDPKFVKVRPGAITKDGTKAIALFYIDSREVMKRLDDVVGVGNWCTKSRMEENEVFCDLYIRMPEQPLDPSVFPFQSDVGERSRTSPIKGATSDALKRAAVRWGIGRYLYYIPNKYYKLDQYKRFAEKPVLPNWAVPNKKIPRWEDVAIARLTEAEDISIEELDDLEFVDEQARRTITDATHTKEELIAYLKGAHD